MRIWYLNHYASTPDQPMTGAYFLMQALAEQGHDITVFASGFNYYRRKELRLKGFALSCEEKTGDVTMRWVRTLPTSGGAITRLLNMLSYTVVVLALGLFPKAAPQVVMASCPHPFAGFAGWLLAKRWRARFIYEVRDIWPESMIEAGVFSASHPLAKIMRAMQKKFYADAAPVVSVLPYFDRYLQENKLDYKQFLWLPNSVAVQPDALPELPDARHQPEVFTFMYLGGHSKYQGLDTLVEAAKLLEENAVENIRLVLVGDGSEKARLQEKVRSLGLKNLTFRDAVPRSDILRTAGEADAFILHFQAIPLLRYGISNNKLCDYMLAGRPVIFAADAANNPVAEAQCGLTIPPESPQAMADAMQKLHNLPAAERAAMAQKARAYALEHFDVRKQAEKLESALTS